GENSAGGGGGSRRGRAGRSRPAGKGRDDLDRNLRVGAAGETRDRRGIEARPSVRDIKAAIAGKPVEHGFGKAERGRFASGRDILHFTFPPPLDAGQNFLSS